MSVVQVATSVELQRQLAQGARALGLELAPDTLRKLIEFARLLGKWNRTYNLTAIREESRIVSHHLLDSLALALYLKHGRILDVGSGGGFPGMPLALVRPRLQFTLIDSSQKKTAFLRQAAAELVLENVSVICERVESWRSSEPFDWIVSRAFAELSGLIRAASHLLAPGGVIAAMKGVHPEQEVAKLPAGFRVRDIIRLEVPGVEAERHLVIVERA